MKGFAKRGNRKGEKGFTLVELLIVFTLLGVLAAIMIPNVAGLIGYGHDAGRRRRTINRADSDGLDDGCGEYRVSNR